MNYFKSIITLFIVAITLNSCSSDDDSNDVDTSLIVGEWALNSSFTESISEVTFLGISVTTVGETVGSNFDYTVTFNEDGTYVANGSYTATVTSMVDGESFPSETITISDTNASGTWSLEGDQLTTAGLAIGQVDGDLFDGEVPEGSSTITTLNDTTLTLEGDFSDIDPIGGDIEFEGAEFDFSGTSTSSFTRVN